MSNARLRPTEVAFYEGLVRKTAALYAPHVQEDYEDIVSIFRIKVWRALEAFDPARSRMPIESYVFGCVKNQGKDLLRRKRRQEVAVADVAEFPLALSEECVYGEVRQQPPVIPSTLTAVERAVLVCLYAGRSQREAASELVLKRSEMERVMRSIRVKMADWRPTAVGERERAEVA